MKKGYDMKRRIRNETSVRLQCVMQKLDCCLRALPGCPAESRTGYTVTPGFFFLWYGRSRLRLGPYMRRSGRWKITWTRLVTCSMANQNNRNQKPPKPSDTQIPQPDLRFAIIRKTAKQTAKWARAQQKHPHKKICHWTQWCKPLCQ